MRRPYHAAQPSRPRQHIHERRPVIGRVPRTGLDRLDEFAEAVQQQVPLHLVAILLPGHDEAFTVGAHAGFAVGELLRPKAGRHTAFQNHELGMGEAIAVHGVEPVAVGGGFHAVVM